MNREMNKCMIYKYSSQRLQLSVQLKAADVEVGATSTTGNNDDCGSSGDDCGSCGPSADDDGWNTSDSDDGVY